MSDIKSIEAIEDNGGGLWLAVRRINGELKLFSGFDMNLGESRLVDDIKQAVEHGVDDWDGEYEGTAEEVLEELNHPGAGRVIAEWDQDDGIVIHADRMGTAGRLWAAQEPEFLEREVDVQNEQTRYWFRVFGAEYAVAEGPGDTKAIIGPDGAQVTASPLLSKLEAALSGVVTDAMRQGGEGEVVAANLFDILCGRVQDVGDMVSDRAEIEAALKNLDATVAYAEAGGEEISTADAERIRDAGLAWVSAVNDGDGEWSFYREAARAALSND